ncbi:hypothetical protein LNV08_09365 [Paucibacter sp. TC2R-5]|uniref:hypothetical protein n=1 Tax=Paucibacter sp. TC2R-5 TaxID=2893555 RepID=UPI0021E3B812|nr:hypothetical protein [Paucibacter sp. TC2R-5]MCV2359183.1 hypothetical protein [Paucibacter sp. TC2R-5]
MDTTQFMQTSFKPKLAQVAQGDQADQTNDQFELRFQSLFHSGKALAFPCDSQGDVMLDLLSARALENYLFARAVVGHEYANPVIQVRED